MKAIKLIHIVCKMTLIRIRMRLLKNKIRKLMEKKNAIS